MSTFVTVNTYAHSVVYVTNNLLSTLKDIINLSGLSPENLTSSWVVLERGIETWLRTQDLTQVVLEVFDPATDDLVGRWDLAIQYGFVGDGTFWVNPEEIRYHILKQGIWPANCGYCVLATTKQNRPDVEGWIRTSTRSTDGFVKQSIGTTIGGSGLNVSTGYWRKE